MHLVELCGSGLYFAMKAMDKGVMLNRNKVFEIELIMSIKLQTQIVICLPSNDKPGSAYNYGTRTRRGVSV